MYIHTQTYSHTHIQTDIHTYICTFLYIFTYPHLMWTRSSQRPDSGRRAIATQAMVCWDIRTFNDIMDIIIQ